MINNGDGMSKSRSQLRRDGCRMDCGLRIRKYLAAVILACATLIAGCKSVESQTGQSARCLFTQKTQENIRQVASSVVGVGAMYDYHVESFHHEFEQGSFIRDTGSTTGYKLLPGVAGTTRSDTTIRVHGTGLIICQDGQQAVVLTSQHILASADTSSTFHRDSSGVSTGILYSRAIKVKSTYFIDDQNGRARAAEVLYTDPRTDLGLLLVPITSPIGIPLPCDIAYKTSLGWGDLAVVFGYPHQAKQLTLGIISPSPYAGNFVIDAATRFGSSGGPIFVIRTGGLLELTGIMRAIPATELRYVAPPQRSLPGDPIGSGEIDKLRAEQMFLTDAGTAYGIGVEKIGKFLQDALPKLESQGIQLPARFFPH
jgi:S1-C subfamily serine protease